MLLRKEENMKKIFTIVKVNDRYKDDVLSIGGSIVRESEGFFDCQFTEEHWIKHYTNFISISKEIDMYKFISIDDKDYMGFHMWKEK